MGPKVSLAVFFSAAVSEPALLAATSIRRGLSVDNRNVPCTLLLWPPATYAGHYVSLMTFSISFFLPLELLIDKLCREKVDDMSRTGAFIVELVKMRDNMLHISNVFSIADITDIISFYVLHEVIHCISFYASCF